MSKKQEQPIKVTNLLHQVASILHTQERQHQKQHRDLQLAVARLERRVEVLEKRNQRLTSRMTRVAQGHKQRQRQRHVHHNVSPVEKAHLCATWSKFRKDEAALAREGRALARTYKLDFKRQVAPWFVKFEGLQAHELKKLRAQAPKS